MIIIIIMNWWPLPTRERGQVILIVIMQNSAGHRGHARQYYVPLPGNKEVNRRKQSILMGAKARTLKWTARGGGGRERERKKIAELTAENQWPWYNIIAVLILYSISYSMKIEAIVDFCKLLLWLLIVHHQPVLLIQSIPSPWRVQMLVLIGQSPGNRSPVESKPFSWHHYCALGRLNGSQVL